MYVASLRKVVPMLEHANARVLIAVDNTEYADSLFEVAVERALEGAKPWADGDFFRHQRKIRFENGSTLFIEVIHSWRRIGEISGQHYSNILYGRLLTEDVVVALNRYARMPGDFTGTVTCQQFEEWRDQPFQLPKEEDDKAVL